MILFRDQLKTPKLYFYDSGLAAYLLGIKSPEQLAVHPHRGAVFETFVASEIMKSACHNAEAPSFYFWRDRSGKKIDFLIDRGSGLLPIEAKSGKTVASDWLNGLTSWRAFAGDRAQNGSPFIQHGRENRESTGRLPMGPERMNSFFLLGAEQYSLHRGLTMAKRWL